MSYSSINGNLGSYGEYMVFNNGEKINLLDINTSKIVNITEENMNIFKNESGFYYSKCFSNVCMTKDYIYFMCDQINNANAFIYDVNANVYYTILDKADSEKDHIGRFYCKDKSIILKYNDSAKITKALYIVAK